MATTTTMLDTATQFFTRPHFAVAGASDNPSKAGYQILAFYYGHTLPVVPINPARKAISFPTSGTTLESVQDVSYLPSPESTALSIVTGPAVTKGVLEMASKKGVKAVWLQPGTFDDEGLEFAKGNFEVVVGGKGEGTKGENGWCVLADGEEALRRAEREWVKQEV